jgi:hypothetical protein
MRDWLTWLLLVFLLAAVAFVAKAQPSSDHDRIVALEYEIRDAQDVAGVVALLDNRLQRIEGALTVVEWIGGGIAALALGIVGDAIKRRLTT